MEFLEALWLLWMDGWTGDHWSTIIWTASTTGFVVCMALAAYFQHLDNKRYCVKARHFKRIRR